jgi:putative ABC transport system permease protein
VSGVLYLSWRTFRDHWPIFVGAIVSVCLGVALVQSSLLMLVSAATATVPPGLPDPQARALRDGYEGTLSLLGMTLGLAFFVTIFIVSSTFAFTVAQRRRDLALIRLTGAGRGQLRTLLLGEALLLGVVGAGLGVLVGLPVMRLQERILGGFDLVPPGFTAQWRSWILAVSLGSGVGIALAGVLAASARAARVRPLEALRDVGAAARVMTASRSIVGLLFLAGGATMVVLAPLLGGEAAIALSVLVSMLLIVAFTAFAPLLVPLISRLLRLFTPGLLGQLAQANLRSGVRRSASTAAPIMVLVAFVASLAGTMGTVGEGSRQELSRTLGGDLVVTSDRPVGPELATVEGVGAASEEAPAELEVRVADGDGEISYESVDATIVDPTAYARTHRLDLRAGDLADLHGDAVAVRPSLDLPTTQIGDELPVRVDGQERSLRVVALLPPTIVGTVLLLPTGIVPDQGGPRTYVIELAEGADGPAVAGELAGFGPVATTADWISRTAAEQERMSIAVMVALLGVAMVYTVISMVNAVVISASDRSAEFATARVTGLTRGQVVRMALAESVAVVVIGLLLGALAAAGTVLGIAIAVHDLVGVTVVSVPWGLLGALTAGAGLVVGVTTVLTTWSTTRVPPIRLVAARE